MKAVRIAILILAVACYSSLPAFAQRPLPLPDQHSQAPPQQTTGRVVNLSESSLTVEVLEPGAIKPVDFAIDSNTDIDGRVAKDAHVQVSYRVEDGRNVATLVMVVA